MSARVLRRDPLGRIVEVRGPAEAMVGGRYEPVAESVRLERAHESGHDLEGSVRVRGRRYSAFTSGGPDDFVIVIRDFSVAP